MPDLQTSYPRVRGCYYQVVLTNGREIGRFRSGEWERERHNNEPEIRLRMVYPKTDPRGNIGLKPEEIAEVRLVCPPYVEVELVGIPGPFPGLGAPVITDPPVPQPPACQPGDVWEGRTTETESDFELVEVEEDPPAIEGAVMELLSDYLPSASHVKCWMYAKYQKTTTKTTERLKCENGAWVDMDDLVVTTVETVRLRLHVGGNPCQHWAAFPPPNAVTDLPQHNSLGWIDDTSTTSTTTGN